MRDTSGINHKKILERLIGKVSVNNSLAGKTIMVTGASGQIGLNIVAKALAGGANVIGVYHKTSIAFTHPNLRWLQCDLTSGSGLKAVEADVFIHTAAIWLLPGILPQLLASGMRRIIVFGSTSVFGKMDSGNPKEQGVVKKLKTAEEEIFHIIGNSATVTVLRPTMIYGMGMDANITRMARMIRKFGVVPVCLPASGLRQPVQAVDLADAALAIMDNARTYGKSYNLGGGKPLAYRAMVGKLFLYLGKKPKLVNIPFLPVLLDHVEKLFPFTHINGEVLRRMNRDLVFDIIPAVEDFGYNPKAFLEGDVTL